MWISSGGKYVLESCTDNQIDVEFWIGSFRAKHQTRSMAWW